jgi:mono/diheme cytochrome c family protein
VNGTQVVITIGYAVFVAAAVWVSVLRQHREAPRGSGGQLFSTTCGSCHTLAAAGTSGSIGPSLDDLGPDAAQVVAAIERGGAGTGAMPANLLSGADAQTVADFVAQSAGR